MLISGTKCGHCLFRESVEARSHPRVATTSSIYLFLQCSLDAVEGRHAVLGTGCGAAGADIVSGRGGSCPADVTLSHLPDDVINRPGHPLPALGHRQLVDGPVQPGRQSPPLVRRHAPRMRRAVGLVGDEHQRRAVVMATQVPDCRQVGVEPEERLAVGYRVE